MGDKGAGDPFARLTVEQRRTLEHQRKAKEDARLVRKEKRRLKKKSDSLVLEDTDRKERIANAADKVAASASNLKATIRSALGIKEMTPIEREVAAAKKKLDDANAAFASLQAAGLPANLLTAQASARTTAANEFIAALAKQREEEHKGDEKGDGNLDDDSDED